MTIPKYDEIRVPAMQLLNNIGATKLKEFESPLGEYFQLTEEELTQEYESGNGRIFNDRISWAMSSLYLAELVEKPARGTYRLSKLGTNLLDKPDDINNYIKETLTKRDSKKKNKKEHIVNEEIPDDLTPQEKLYSSYDKIRKSINNEILEVILSKSPREFEKLVVSLLQKMGYGGEISNSGLVTQSSNDQGIDGIIKEDVLGLGRIHIQAKRYAIDNSVGREAIQNFVGALAVAQSNKGVFITTSSYTKSAVKYAENLNGTTTLVLIDGQKLADYIYDFELGMQVEQTIEIKKLDSDFWDSMQDDES